MTEPKTPAPTQITTLEALAGKTIAKAKEFDDYGITNVALACTDGSFALIDAGTAAVHVRLNPEPPDDVRLLVFFGLMTAEQAVQEEAERYAASIAESRERRHAEYLALKAEFEPEGQA